MAAQAAIEGGGHLLEGAAAAAAAAARSLCTLFVVHQRFRSG